MTDKGADLVAQQQADTGIGTAVAGKAPTAGRRAKRRADEDPVVLEDLQQPGDSAVALHAPKRAKVVRLRQPSGHSSAPALLASKAGSTSNAACRQSTNDTASAFAEGLHLLSTVMEDAEMADAEMADAEQPMLQASVWGTGMQGASAAQQDTVHRLRPAGKTRKKNSHRGKPVWR